MRTVNKFKTKAGNTAFVFGSTTLYYDKNNKLLSIKEDGQWLKELYLQEIILNPEDGMVFKDYSDYLKNLFLETFICYNNNVADRGNWFNIGKQIVAFKYEAQFDGHSEPEEEHCVDSIKKVISFLDGNTLFVKIIHESNYDYQGYDSHKNKIIADAVILKAVLQEVLEEL